MLHLTFENGMMPQGTMTDMRVKPKILTENGQTFLRITGSYGDNNSVPSRKFPHRVRATVAVTAHQSHMPMQTDANRRQFYSADIRFHTDNTGVFMELFQHGDKKGGYGTPDGTGPVAIFYRRHGRVYFRASYDNGTKMNNYDLGPTVNGVFQNYAVKAVWSDNPREGRIEVYVNGTRKRTITGRGTNLGPKSDRLPLLKFGLYGDHAVGSIDLSNVVINS